jgi:hypothetical protein
LHGGGQEFESPRLHPDSRHGPAGSGKIVRRGAVPCRRVENEGHSQRAAEPEREPVRASSEQASADRRAHGRFFCVPCTLLVAERRPARSWSVGAAARFPVGGWSGDWDRRAGGAIPWAWGSGLNKSIAKDTAQDPACGAPARERAWRKEGRTGDALAPGADEGRGRLRKASGSRQPAWIRGCPNAATRRGSCHGTPL